MLISGLVVGVCYKGREHMNDTLNRFYNRFYTSLPTEDAEQEIEDCHKQLIERLEKTERKLVLWIMDTRSLSAKKCFHEQFPLCGQIGVGTDIQTDLL